MRVRSRPIKSIAAGPWERLGSPVVATALIAAGLSSLRHLSQLIAPGDCDSLSAGVFVCSCFSPFQHTLLPAPTLRTQAACGPVTPPPLFQIVATLVGLGLLARRYRFLRASLHGVAEDAERYEARWRRLTDEPNASLVLLAKITDEIAAGDGSPSFPAPVRQLQRATSPPDPGSGDGCNPTPMAAIPLFRAGMPSEDSYDRQSVVGLGDPARPTGSLDQLYSQAAGASPLLREVCGVWAAANTGVLDSADQRGVAAASRAGYGMVTAEFFRYLKDPARAVEKAVSCYRGDSSRLTDVCRCRIVFESVADLTSCVEMARTDAGVEIVRVRNGMQPGSDASGTGGFRVWKGERESTKRRDQCAGGLARRVRDQV